MRKIVSTEIATNLIIKLHEEDILNMYIDCLKASSKKEDNLLAEKLTGNNKNVKIETTTEHEGCPIDTYSPLFIRIEIKEHI